MWSNDVCRQQLGILGMARIWRLVIWLVLLWDKWNRQQRLGCKAPTIDRASCIHGFFRRKLIQHHRVVGVEHHIRISSNWWSTQHCLGRCQRHIHSQVLRLVLLQKWKEKIYKHSRHIFRCLLTVMFPHSTFYGPVVVTVVVNISFSIVQQTIFTCFQC
jgi:hypothetical protein